MDEQPKTKSSQEKWEIARKLKEQGLTGRAIAEQLGVTPGRVSQVLGQRRAKSQ